MEARVSDKKASDDRDYDLTSRPVRGGAGSFGSG